MSTIIKYEMINGLPTLSNRYIEKLYLNMRKDRTFYRVFYDVNPNQFGIIEFVDFFRNIASLWVSIDDDGSTEAMVWLTDICPKKAEIHFNVFKKYWGNSQLVVESIFNHVFNLKINNEYIFNLLCGYIPITNTLALKAAIVHMEIIAEIPNYCWIFNEQKSIPATLLARRR